MTHSETSLLNNQAFELLDRGDKQGAKKLFKKASTQDMTDSESRMMIGVILAEEGDMQTSEEYLRQALSLDNEYSDAYYYLANVLRAKGKEDEAIAYLERSVELDPDFANAVEMLGAIHLNLANKLLQQNNLKQALSYFEKMTVYQSTKATNWFMLGRTRGLLGQYTDAERCMRQAISIDPNLAEAHFILASFLLMQGRTEDACQHCNKAIQIDPNNVDAIAMAANIAKRMGDPDESYRLLAPLLEKGVQQINVALSFAMISKDVGRQQEAIILLESMLNSETSSNPATSSKLHFNLGNLYDNVNKYDEAFMHYRSGNKLKDVSFDQQKHVETIDRYISTFTKEFMDAMSRSTVSTDRPIFVVGMVRSGTSLIEQILASHPEVFGAGELGDIYQMTIQLPTLLKTDIPYPECLSLLSQEFIDELSQSYLEHLLKISPDANRVVDKLPANFMNLGLIELLFPNARIIHCKRNPVDTCLSTYFQDFSSKHDYAYDLKDLVVYYQEYQKLMTHWKSALQIPILEVNYEDLIADQELVSQDLVEFCGVDWHDDCLQFYKNKRFVRTASFDQVNRPLYSQSVARWKNYEKYIEPLLILQK